LQYAQWETDAAERHHDYEIVGNVEFLAAPLNDTAVCWFRAPTRARSRRSRTDRQAS
jgi:hypothetical protein